MRIIDLTEHYIEDGFAVGRAIALAVQDCRQHELDIQDYYNTSDI